MRIFCSFGHRCVPGSEKDLFRIKSEGGDVRVVYPAGCDHAGSAEPRPRGRVLRHRVRDHRAGQRDDGAPGAPAGAGQLLLVSHVLVPPAIAAIMESPSCRCRRSAGHVCGVMGTAEHPPLAERYEVPIVVTGFEPLDILEGIRRAVIQPETGRSRGERLPARGACRGQPCGAGDAGRGLHGHRPGGAASRSCAAAGGSPWPSWSSTPSGGSPSRTSTRRSRRSAGPARCCRA